MVGSLSPSLPGSRKKVRDFQAGHKIHRERRESGSFQRRRFIGGSGHRNGNGRRMVVVVLKMWEAKGVRREGVSAYMPQ